MQKIMDRMTNVVMNYSEVESKVREATNDDAWGPHGSVMSQLAKYTFTYEHYPEVMAMVWKRMFESKKNWRRTYKSLLLLHYLILNGSERVVSSSREHIYDMKPLEEYQFSDEHGKDQGINIRQKAKEVIGFLQDDERLREARKTARSNRDKYVGISSSEETKKYSDRYSQEPRSKGTFYDEDIRGPVGTRYTDNVEESDEESHSKLDQDKPSSTEQVSKPEEPSFGGFETLNQDSPSTVRKTGGQPSKLVDLGAAATFAQQSAPKQPAQQSGSELLFGDPQQSSPSGGFADFQSAFSKAPEESQSAGVSGFGDFASFQSVPAPQPAPAQPQQPAFADFGVFQSTPSTGMSQPFLQPQPANGDSLLMPSQSTQEQPSLLDMSEPEQPQAQKPSATGSNTIWNSSGLNIDLDNLMAPAKPKATSNAGRPSMNQLAQSSSFSTTATSTTNPSFASGPNYNINTSPAPQPRVPMSSMGIQPGPMSMGMQQPGMGMGQPGMVGMGMRPQSGTMGMPTGAGMGMNYAGGMRGYGNTGYMQGQQRTQPGFGVGMGTTQTNMGMQYQRPF